MSVPSFPTSAPQTLLPFPGGPHGGCWASGKRRGEATRLGLPWARRVCPAQASPAGVGRECHRPSASGVKGGGGPTAGQLREGGGAPLARPLLGEGAWRAAPLLSCSQQWPWDQLCPLCPLPAWTQGSRTPSSQQPASCQPQLLPHHCPPPCPASPDTHPTQWFLCQKGECVGGGCAGQS